MDVPATSSYLPIGRTGTAKDLELAGRITGSSRVYAAMQPSEESPDSVTCHQFWPFFFPCWWPCFPCVLPCILNQREILRRTLYIVTEDSVFISVEDHEPPCSCGCTTGRDSVEIPFDSIVDITVDNRGRGCVFCVVPCVVLSLVRRSVVLYVKEPDQVAQLIRQLRTTNKDRQRFAVLVQQQEPITNQIPAIQIFPPKKRIFVALSTNPESVSLAMLDGDTDEARDQFLREIRSILKLNPETSIRLTLADTAEAEINHPDQLNANDKIIVHQVFESLQ